MISLWRASAGCSVSIDFAGTQYQCPDGVTCPPGYSCVDFVCEAGEPADAGPELDGGGNPALRCGDQALVRTDFASGAPWWMYQSIRGGSVALGSGAAVVGASLVADEATDIGDIFHTSLVGGRVTVEVSDVATTEPWIAFVESGDVHIELALIAPRSLAGLPSAALTPAGRSRMTPSLTRSGRSASATAASPRRSPQTA